MCGRAIRWQGQRSDVSRLAQERPYHACGEVGARGPGSSDETAQSIRNCAVPRYSPRVLKAAIKAGIR